MTAHLFVIVAGWTFPCFSVLQNPLVATSAAGGSLQRQILSGGKKGAHLKGVRKITPRPAVVPWEVDMECDVLQARVHGRSFDLLSGISPQCKVTSDATGQGLFLSFDGAPERSVHRFSLGTLGGSRLLAGARIKRWWMGPVFGTDASAVPPETQFLLVELSDGAYAFVQPLVSGEMRCTLRGDSQGKLIAEVQSGDATVVCDGMETACYVACGDNPYELLRRSFTAVSDRLGTFEVTSRKRKPEDLDLFGWCTWDAFYQAVDPAGIARGLRSLHSAGAPPRMLIIDDGWQTVVQDGAEEIGTKSASEAEAMSSSDAEEAHALNKPQDAEAEETNPILAPFVEAVFSFYRDRVDGADVDTPAVRVWRACANSVLKPELRRFFAEKTEFSKRLGSFTANSKFEDPDAGTSLRGMLADLRDEFGQLRVYAWHTLGGYWGGISTESEEMAALRPNEQMPSPTRSLLEVEPALGWDSAALNGCGTAERGNELRLMHGIHSYLARSGVDGVKVDAQSGLGPFGKGLGGGPSFVRRSVRAMEASVEEHFEGSRCVNCMCHSTENLYNYRSTSLLRAADDFYPTDADAQPVHLAHVAYNSLFLGEIGTPDWDMFQSAHEDAGMHAAARAISGGPLYVSDAPGRHDEELLRRLVLPDGTQLRCKGAGRPTRDGLFVDPNSDGTSPLKLWNRNEVTGVLAAFNVQGSRWSLGRRAFVRQEAGGGAGTGGAQDEIECRLRAEDVEGLADGFGEGVVQAGAEWEGMESPPTSSVLFGHRSQAILHLAAGETHTLKLGTREWEMFIVSRVEDRRGVRWAPLGLTDMLNGGGAVVESALEQPLFMGTPQARVGLSASGNFGAYCDPRPRAVRVEGQGPVEFEYDEASGMLRVELPRRAESVRLVVDFPRGPKRKL
jgi:raffinose synthase